MSNIEKVLKYISFSSPELLSKKDLTEVYKVVYKNNVAILKIFEEEFSYYREVTSLRLLGNKKVRCPGIYAVVSPQEKSLGVPFYFIEEFLPGNILLEEFSHYDDEQKCCIIYDCGCLLGRLNTQVSKCELEKSDLWKYAYEGVGNYKQYKWSELYIKQIPNWLENIRKENDLDYSKIADCILDLLKKLDNTENLGLIHRDYGFRNILVVDGKVSSVIDFEYAVIGDIFFDLSKLIFNNLNFEHDKNLINVFFDGWTSITKIDFSMDELWLYLAVQGLGAIQWVDRQKDEQVCKRNRDYRDNGKKILIEAFEKISL